MDQAVKVEANTGFKFKKFILLKKIQQNITGLKNEQDDNWVIHKTYKQGRPFSSSANDD